jgi:hypothetical protein
MALVPEVNVILVFFVTDEARVFIHAIYFQPALKLEGMARSLP